MPPLSTGGYHTLNYKTLVNICWLEAKVEVNGLWGDETTIPLSQTREHKHANELLTSMLTNSVQAKKESFIKEAERETKVASSKSECSCPLANSLPAKSKDKWEDV